MQTPRHSSIRTRLASPAMISKTRGWSTEVTVLWLPYPFKFLISPFCETLFAPNHPICFLLKYSYPPDFSLCAHSAKLNLKSLISCAIGYLCGHDIDHVGKSHEAHAIAWTKRATPERAHSHLCRRYIFWVVGPNKLRVWIDVRIGTVVGIASGIG